jgi:hypothetical protein
MAPTSPGSAGSLPGDGCKHFLIEVLPPNSQPILRDSGLPGVARVQQAQERVFDLQPVNQAEVK